MTSEDAVKWLKNLKDDIGNHSNASLWHYEQALFEIIELLKEQKEQCNKLDYLFSKIAGHSDYHGDSILTAIICVKEGKEIGNVIPKDGERE